VWPIWELNLAQQNGTLYKLYSVGSRECGAAQPVGFPGRLVIGGIFVQSIDWRFGCYIGAILNFAIFIVSIFGIPVEQCNIVNSGVDLMVLSNALGVLP
jgi:hypothetical protein